MKSTLKISIFSTCLALFAVSCNNGAETEIDATDASEIQAEPATERGEIADPVMNNNTNANGGEVALNPPHGEPGHVCEIAVGAPLNTAPNSGGNQNDIQLQQNQDPNQVQTQNQPAGQTGGAKPKINPPHGEPGHDCAVPVGSPLN